jgi:hypothetical protein
LAVGLVQFTVHAQGLAVEGEGVGQVSAGGEGGGMVVQSPGLVARSSVSRKSGA